MILKRGGREGSGQRLISLSGITNRMLLNFLGELVIFLWTFSDFLIFFITFDFCDFFYFLRVFDIYDIFLVFFKVTLVTIKIY